MSRRWSLWGWLVRRFTRVQVRVYRWIEARIRNDYDLWEDED